MSTHKPLRARSTFDDGSPTDHERHSRRRRSTAKNRAAFVPEPVVDRKALQLCRQVEHTLADVLAGECDDEVLQCLDVLGVKPAPDASRLLVTLAPGVAARPCPIDEVLSRLNHHAGQLRSEVASAITRKKAPTLIYQVVPNPVGMIRIQD